MRHQLARSSHALSCEKVIRTVCLLLVFFLIAVLPANGAIVYDAERAVSPPFGPQWWFDPVNWNVNMNANNVLPPNGGTAFDAQINRGIVATEGTVNLPGGDGVVYDPANDPNFANA